MRTTFRRIAKALNTVGLGSAALRAFGVARNLSRPRQAWANRRLRRMGAPDGFPIPPDSLLFLISGEASVGGYLSEGAKVVQSIQQEMSNLGRPIQKNTAILDFGCGCGRVLRHWRGIDNLSGSDYNPKLVRWCQENLPHARVQINDLLPPLPFPSGAFDLVYVLSVFTHLPKSAQGPWMEEIRRVLRPGGTLLVTFHGPAFLHLLNSDEVDRFSAGEMVVANAEYAGTNVCAAFHPEPYVRSVLASDWKVLAFHPQGAGGVGVGPQDLYMLEPITNHS
jgi:SAM-dependent methyltransferase